MSGALDIVILGLSITSSWGNGHATTYRGLVRELAAAGHRVTFLERDVPWYAAHRDRPDPEGAETILYASLEELYDRHAARVRTADAVIVGSYVPDGVAVGDWVQAEARGLAAFYDIDTPVTLAALAKGGTEYLAARQIPGYGLYLSFTGGPTLRRLEGEFGSPMARALYCSVDPDVYRPEEAEADWALGYIGTTAPTGSRPWTGFWSGRPGTWPTDGSSSPGRSTPATSAGPRMSSGSSICRPHGTAPSTTGRPSP